MQTEALHYLLTVAKTHSLNKASSLLDVPYQSINYALQNLEVELQTQILDRTPAGTFLTDSGEIVKEFSEKFLNDYNQLKKTLSQYELEQHETKRKILSVCSAPLLQNTIVPTLISKFGKNHPDVLLFSYSNNSITDVLSSIQSHEIDFFMSFANKKTLSILKTTPEIQYQILGRCYFFLVCSSTHPLAKKKSIRIKEFLDYPLALFKTSPSSSEIEIALSNYATIHYGHITDNLSIFLSTIRYEQMIGLTCTYQYKNKKVLLLSENNPDLIFIPIEDSSLIYCCTISHKDVSLEKKELFEDFLSLFKEL